MQEASKILSLHEKVEEALSSIRPYLETDGGDLKLIEITEDKVVKVALLGSCETCPMSEMTMKAGVEKAILSRVPEIHSVVSINA